MSFFIVVSTPVWVPHVAFGPHAHVPLASLTACLGFRTLAQLPWLPFGETQAGEGVVPAVEGSEAGFSQSALERTRLEVESHARHQREHSVCDAATMVRISPSWRYNLSSPLEDAVGGGIILRRVAVAAMFCLALVKEGRCPPPSQLMVGVTLLA
jgi:hypothetical protein